MRTQDYLDEVAHALDHQITGIWAEHRALEEISASLMVKTKETEDGYRRAEAWMQEEHPDDFMIGVGEHWDTYFGADKERHGLAHEEVGAQERMAARDFSRGAMAASVLQIAKQAISIVHGKLPAAPDGRAVGSQMLKDVIWQGRNQSMHWEDGNLNQAVSACFGLLASDFDPCFTNFGEKNMAFEVVRVLGWTDTGAVMSDILLLS